MGAVGKVAEICFMKNLGKQRQLIFKEARILVREMEVSLEIGIPEPRNSLSHFSSTGFWGKLHN